uniref:Protein kinase n=1 Tax=Pithovirus LCPAC304 TaxID=2506594 RepID=A0A481Z8T8_9VIRU|nr:MAG: protein kinase [Pithovirus LCPAC304]
MSFAKFLFVNLQTKKDNRTKFCWFLPNIGMSIGSTVQIFDDEKLGEGSYGAVYRCCDEYGKAYAVKCIKINEMGIPNILENSIMKTISHPALNTALHIHTTAREVHIFQRLAETDMARYTRRKDKCVPPDLLQKWSYSLVQAVACLHRQKIIHADVKANNVLLFEDKTVKLGDFTLAVCVWDSQPKKSQKPERESLSADDVKTAPSLFTHRVCTYSHRPPECWFRKGWSYPLDIWSLGCTLFEIAYGQLLFPSQGKITDKDPKKAIQKKKIIYKSACNCLLEWARNGPNASSEPKWMESFKMHPSVTHKRATFPLRYARPEYREFNALVLWMLKIDPIQRPTIDQILKHSYFTKLTSLPYKIVSTMSKIIPRRDQQRLSRYLDQHSDHPKVRDLATELYGRCTLLKCISEPLKIVACVWIAEKLVRIRPRCNGLSRMLILQCERQICQHLSFRLHTCAVEN